MITAYPHPTLADYVHCARDISQDAIDAYKAITGLEWEPDTVAAKQWLLGGFRWGFWETVGNYPVAVGGFVEVRQGIFSSWFMDTPSAWKRGKEITTAVASCIKFMLQQPDVLRLETVTLATREKARAWYGQIGLTYDPGSNFRANGHELVTYVAVR